MKKSMRILSMLFAFALVVSITSCQEDNEGSDIIVDPGDGDGGGTLYQVADGIYLAGKGSSDTTITIPMELSSTLVEDAGFASKERAGFFTNFVYLTPGEYFYAEVEDQLVTNTFGGTATSIDSIEAMGSFMSVDLIEGGAAFSVAAEGLYHVVYDQQESEGILIPVATMGILGDAVYESPCVSGGYNEDIDLILESSSAEGTSWKGTGVILRSGAYKFRYNNSWTLDTREGTATDPFDATLGYVLFTNFGGMLETMEEGGANITLTGDPGTYDVTFSIDKNGATSAAITRTGDADACSFNPANFSWGIIGAATFGTSETEGWSAHKKLQYINGDGGVHKWYGVFPVKKGNSEFKFRADDNWANKITSGSQGVSVTVTDNTESGSITNNGDVNDDGSWFIQDALSTDYLWVKITTPDQGATWTLEFDEAQFYAIGEGSPVGNWDSNGGTATTVNAEDVTMQTVSGDFTTGGWKFYVNGSFDYNIGGALDGTTALEFNNSTFNFDAAGTYTVTLKTADGGVTYTASAQ